MVDCRTIRSIEQHHAAAEDLAFVNRFERARRRDLLGSDHDFDEARPKLVHARIEHDASAIDEGDLIRFRCHVGHTYTADLMALALDDNLRRALGSALRAMEERRTLAVKLREQAEHKGQPRLAASWARRSHEFQRELDIVRGAIVRLDEITARQESRRAAE